uniref:Putative sodium channel alpha-toxin Acra7 n=1 Tax=Androctonus crassicauda TaxID=122909 RepID=SCX7_ANDCR
VRDGYIVKPTNCVIHCIPFSPGCDKDCKEKGAASGYCQAFGKHGNGCWCIDLPDKVPIKDPNQDCTR